MPTPYTEGNGCKYCQVKEILVGSADPLAAAKVKKTLQCTCQGPELVECDRKWLQTAIYCEYFKPESEEVDKFIQNLQSTIAKAAFDVKLNKPFTDFFKHEDVVNHPSHYTSGGIECIDAIKAALECHEDPVGAWLTGQCLKYLWRWPLKNGLEDLKKCQFYLNKLIERMEK